jgi:putative membrane-bound dehydrogenase-like protein
METRSVEFKMRLPSICSLFASLALSTGLAIAADEDKRVVTIGDIKFTIPQQYELTQVATEPLTKWPLIADWDQHGHLLLVESAGVGKPIAEHNKQELHRIVRLIDRDQDGKFDERVVVADKLPFTEGVLALGNDLLACAPPNIYKLSDKDGDGVCEQREVWFDAQTITGCANDLHGPYLGRDGWIYWCKGAFAEQNHNLVGGKQLKTTAAHIFRRRIDGGPIEPVMTGGMDNPVEIAITPEGERFFTSTFLQHPGGGLRDGIAHAVYGGVFGKPHKVIDDHIRTGPLMPIMVQLGPAAPSGLICLESNYFVRQLGQLESVPNQRTLIAALFNLQKVTAHKLQPNGASYTSENLDLVVADRIDFHPTDILEDSDGSLLIVDTGGWYDLCCPTSRIDQKTASGGVYRLTKWTTPNLKTERPAQFAVSVHSLHDERPWVARAALLEISKATGDHATEFIKELTTELNDEKLNLTERLQSLWALCALGSTPALDSVSQVIVSKNAALAQAACNAVSLHRYAPAKQKLEQAVTSGELEVRRAAAEALGRIGDASSIAALMASLDISSPDRHLEHSITFALIEIGAADPLATFAASQHSARQQQAAMTALDQLGAADKLSVDFMLAAVDQADRPCADTAAEILGKHSEWAPLYATKIAARFQQARDSQESPASLLTIARGWKDTPAIQELIGATLKTVAGNSPTAQSQLIQLLNMYSGAALHADWDTSIAEWLKASDAGIREQLLTTLTRLNLSNTKAVQQTLLQLAKKSLSDTEQLQFLAALPSGTDPNDPALESALLRSLRSTDSTNGQAATSALKRIKLSRDGGSQLLASLKDQPPRDLFVSVEAINRLGNDELDESMLKTLVNLPSAKTLSMDQLLNLYRNRGDKLKDLTEQAIKKLSRAPEDIEAQVDATLAKLGPGDPIRGLQMFRSSKTACSSCHRLGYVGGEIGPELSRIGGSRTRRALLEAILFPSARLEQSYQPTRVLTLDGQVYNGIVKNTSNSKTLDLQLTADKSISIATSEIERQEPSQISIMPAGMLELLTAEELADLLALLESGK